MNYAGEKRIREDDQRFQLKAEKDSQIIKQYYEKYITLFSSPKNISSLSLYQEDAYNGFLLWFEFSFSNTDVKVRNNIWIASNCSTETIQKIENKIQKEYIGKSVMIKLPDSEYEFEKYVTTHRTINDSGYLGLDTELTRIKADIYMDDSLINNNINKIVTSTTN
jgi:hypothetical protein